MTSLLQFFFCLSNSGYQSSVWISHWRTITGWITLTISFIPSQHTHTYWFYVCVVMKRSPNKRRLSGVERLKNSLVKPWLAGLGTLQEAWSFMTLQTPFQTLLPNTAPTVLHWSCGCWWINEEWRGKTQLSVSSSADCGFDRVVSTNSQFDLKQPWC